MEVTSNRAGGCAPHLVLPPWGGAVTKPCLTLRDPMQVASQAPLCMEFLRQAYWSGLPVPSPGNLPDPGLNPRPPTLQVDSEEALGQVWGSSEPPSPPQEPCRPLVPREGATGRGLRRIRIRWGPGTSEGPHSPTSDPPPQARGCLTLKSQAQPVRGRG